MEQFPQTLTLNNQPEQPQQPQQQQEQIQQQTEQPAKHNSAFDSVDEAFGDITGERLYSADTVETTADDGTTSFEVNPTSFVPEQNAGLSDAEALKNAAMLMDMREGVQAFGLGYWVDGSVRNYEKYLYEKAAKNRLIEAWAPIIQGANIRVSPWMGVMVAEVMCTGPLLATANEARQYRIALEKAMERNSRLEKENADLKGDARLRRDVQKLWEVNAKGFFNYNEKQKYLGKDSKLRPDFNIPGTLDRLVKHNGKDVIEKIYGL